MNLFNKLFQWYFKKDALPFWCIFLLDCLILMASGVISYWVFNPWQSIESYFGLLMNTLVLFTLLSCIGIRVFYTYAGILRYSSFVDLQRVGYANLLSAGIVLIVHYWMYNYPDGYFIKMNTREIVTMFFLATMLMWAVRILVKSLFDVLSSSKRSIRVLVYGTMSGGVGLAKNILSSLP